MAKKIIYPKDGVKVIIEDKVCWNCGRPSKKYSVIWNNGRAAYVSDYACEECERKKKDGKLS